MFQLVFM
ncbi:uncharacterized, partial [Tachysurus ichikawai]